MAEKEPRGFGRAKRKGEQLAKNVQQILDLLARSSSKASKNRRVVGEFWEALSTLHRLAKAWAERRYKEMPWRSIVLVIAAIIYFVTPFDVIPDMLLFVGFTDDASVVAFVIRTIKSDIDSFFRWEKENQQGGSGAS